MDQPTPDVTWVDVERVLRRDFDSDDSGRVEALLSEVSPPLPPRVVLAVLKLSNGSVEAVSANVEAARRDWRDVIAHAEYPSYMKRVTGTGSVSSAERAEIIQADWEQYSRWLDG